MEVNLTSDQKAFAQRGIESGRFEGPEDAVREALSLWEARERTRAQILSAVDEAEVSLAHGDGRDITAESVHRIAREVKERGRARLAAEQNLTH